MNILFKSLIVKMCCIFGLLLAIQPFWKFTEAQNTYRLSETPFYKSFKKADVNKDSKIAHLSVEIDRETTSEFFYRGREEVLQPLIAAMNQYLDSLQWSPVIESGQLSAINKGAPYLFVGSAESEIAPPSADMLREEFDKFPPMVMHVDKPSKEWKSLLAEQLDQTGSEYALALWIGFNEYPKANKGVFKKKVVLGTGYEPEIRFLSAEDKPVEVLQITGLILNKKGDVIKAGAEAFLYEDTPFWAQVLEVSRSIDDNTIQQSVVDIRRDDLPGKPIAWKVALFHLLETLSQRPQNFSSLELNH